MKKVLFLILILFLFFPKKTDAVGLLVSNEHSQIITTENRAIIIFDKKSKKETLIASQTFSFNPLVVFNFGYLIATPTKPEVTLLKENIFDVFDREFTRTQAVQNSVFGRPAYPLAFDTFSLKNESGKLHAWLAQRGFLLQKDALPIVDSYASQNWYITAIEVDGVHLENKAEDSLTISTAQIMPIVLTFDADMPLLPQKLTSASPDRDSQGVPLAFSYGKTSQEVLGVFDSTIDSMLKTQSQKKYPNIITDALYTKTDVYLLSSDAYQNNRLQKKQTFNTPLSVIRTISEIAAGNYNNFNLSYHVGFTPSIQLEDQIFTLQKKPLFFLVPFVVLPLFICLYSIYWLRAKKFAKP